MPCLLTKHITHITVISFRTFVQFLSSLVFMTCFPAILCAFEIILLLCIRHITNFFRVIILGTFLACVTSPSFTELLTSFTSSAQLSHSDPFQFSWHTFFPESEHMYLSSTALHVTLPTLHVTLPTVCSWSSNWLECCKTQWHDIFPNKWRFRPWIWDKRLIWIINLILN